MQHYMSLKTGRIQVEYLLSRLAAKLTEAIRAIGNTAPISCDQDIVIPGLLGLINVFKGYAVA